MTDGKEAGEAGAVMCGAVRASARCGGMLVVEILANPRAAGNHEDGYDSRNVQDVGPCCAHRCELE